MDQRLTDRQRQQDLALRGNLVCVPGQHAEVIAVADRSGRYAGFACPLRHLIERMPGDDRPEPLRAIDLEEAQSAPVAAPLGERVDDGVADAFDDPGQAKQPVRGIATQLGLKQQVQLLLGMVAGYACAEECGAPDPLYVSV